MQDTQEVWLVARVRRLGGQLAKGFISVKEFNNALFDEFADCDCVYPEIVPTLWDLVPEVAQRELAAEFRAATVPDFRYHAFEIGGRRGLTDEERRSQQVRNGRRVQTWAEVFVRHLASNLTVGHTTGNE